jgi:hypothetical protein
MHSNEQAPIYYVWAHSSAEVYALTKALVMKVTGAGDSSTCPSIRHATEHLPYMHPILSTAIGSAGPLESEYARFVPGNLQFKSLLISDALI